MAKIDLDNVTKRFPDGTIAVNDATFTINDGEFFILVGPSGCGKSTLLNMIVGLEDVSSGEIRVDDDVVNDLDPRHRNMAMVFQSYALYPHMSVRENIAFPLRMAKIASSEIDRRVREAADMLELSQLLDSKPRNLSGGQRQRVAMGRAIVRKPVAFLLDEPLSNLDARLRHQMRTEIARLQRRLGTTTIYVTHDQTEAMTLGDRVAVLKNGVIQQTGTPQKLYEKPRNLFVGGFIGSPAMNFFPVRIHNRRLDFPLLDIEVDVPDRVKLPGELDYAIAGIRPEHFHRVSSDTHYDGEHAVIDLKVDVIEWLGAEVLVYSQLNINYWPEMPVLEQDLGLKKNRGGKLDVVARVEAAAAVREKTKIKLAFDAEKIHLFDPQTGDCLTSKGHGK
jgi:multiple sugar transport system ATP-binding protein